MPLSRRELLFLAATPAAAQVTPEILRYQPEIEPLVSLIERTPREECAAMAVDQFRRGVSYGYHEVEDLSGLLFRNADFLGDRGCDLRFGECFCHRCCDLLFLDFRKSHVTWPY